MTSPDVLVAIASLTEGLGAKEATVRLLASMDALMVLQSIGSVKTLATFIALVAPFATMDQAVLVKDGASEEPLTTHQTVVRPLTRMTLADVVIKIRTDCELAVAVLLLAHKGLNT